jgi:flagellar biosynthesis protein
MTDRGPSAAALEYRAGEDEAPRVTALGRGATAERIIAAARAAGVPIREDPALVELLLQLDLNERIPPELYRAVAEILAFLYRCNREWKAAHGLGRGGPHP